MKKKIFSGIIILAIAAIAAFNVNLNLNEKSNISEFALANVEALAQNESEGSGEDKAKIIRDVEEKKYSLVYYCPLVHFYNEYSGFTRSCSGAGNLDCVPGFHQTGMKELWRQICECIR